MRDAKRREGREVAAHLVRLRQFRSLLRHEEARALVTLAHANAARRTRKTRENARQEEILYVKRDVEAARREKRASLTKQAKSLQKASMCHGAVEDPPVPDEQFVDFGACGEKFVGGRAREPRNMRRRQRTAKRTRDGRRMKHVADGAQAYDEDACAG